MSCCERTIDGEALGNFDTVTSTTVIADVIEAGTITVENLVPTNVNGLPFFYNTGPANPTLCNYATGTQTGMPTIVYTQQEGSFVRIGNSITLSIKMAWRVTVNGSPNIGIGIIFPSSPALLFGASAPLNFDSVVGKTEPNNSVVPLPFFMNFNSTTGVWGLFNYRQQNSTPFYDQYVPIVYPNVGDAGANSQTFSTVITAFIQ